MDKQVQKNLLKLVKQNYEEIAVDFDNTRKKQLWPEINALAELIKDDDKVLDAGCGNGRLVQAFNNKKIEYVGVDSSERLIELAKKNCLLASSEQADQKVGIKSFKFIKLSILELDKLQENNFDYVFCIAVLHHLPGNNLRVEALKQLRNKISANGKVIITVWNLWSQNKFRKLLIKAAWQKIIGQSKFDFGDILFDWKNNKGEKTSQRYYHAFTKHSLKKMIKQANFKIKKIYSDKYNYYIVLSK
jgi:2-polyprenyl-3-methyl-5-hydroxy-6-metoxy-1,4-benzoquinol methylase